VLCEGDTEEIALRYFVVRQWEADGLSRVGLRAINLNGKIQTAGKFANRYLDEKEVLAVFTLVDLQGATQVSHGPEDAVTERVGRVREWLRRQIDHPRAVHFYPHVCVHQTEAWILAEGSALASRLGNPDIGPDLNAEEKNFQNPPSKRLNDLFLRHKSRRYGKKIDGTPLFKAMAFQPVYQSCSHFRTFYEDLKAAARR
jgi:hypothetical protein